MQYLPYFVLHSSSTSPARAEGFQLLSCFIERFHTDAEAFLCTLPPRPLFETAALPRAVSPAWTSARERRRSWKRSAFGEAGPAACERLPAVHICIWKRNEREISRFLCWGSVFLAVPLFVRCVIPVSFQHDSVFFTFCFWGLNDIKNNEALLVTFSIFFYETIEDFPPPLEIPQSMISIHKTIGILTFTADTCSPVIADFFKSPKVGSLKMWETNLGSEIK